jgi:hypothetical protein
VEKGKISMDGWAVFIQLTAGWCHSDRLVNKKGSAELVRFGYAENGKCSECNGRTVSLTKAGLAVAAHMPMDNWADHNDSMN